MRKLKDMQPMNSNERFMYEMIIRQNIIIEQLNSIVEHIGKKDNVAVEKGLVHTAPEQPIDVAVEKPESETVEEKAPVKRARKRTVKE